VQVAQYDFVKDTSIANYSNWGKLAWDANGIVSAAASRRLLQTSDASNGTVNIAAATSDSLPIPDDALVLLTDPAGSQIPGTGQYLRVGQESKRKKERMLTFRQPDPWHRPVPAGGSGAAARVDWSPFS
jgi:hypothetical protein